MLPIETKEVEILRDECEYFQSQAYKEIRRVNMLHYDLARENFVDMGEIQIRSIYDLNIKWQEFLGFYTGLNLERKKYDKKYEIDNKIGEEIEEDLDDEIQHRNQQELL